MDREEPGAPPAQDEFGQPGAITRAAMEMAATMRAPIASYAHMAAALVAGYAYVPRAEQWAALVPVYAAAPATTIASMHAGGGAARDQTTDMAYDANEPIRPRVHEIPHIDPDPGWNLPRPARLPHPTYWPAVLAMGIVILAWGLVTNVIVTAVGVVLFFVALIGWIGDMRHDS